MTETQLSAYLRANYPVEDERCEWKEFKALKNAVSGHKGEDIISYVSALANMEGGRLVIGMSDQNHEIVGVSDPHNYTPQNFPLRLAGNCHNLSTEGLWVEEFITSDTGSGLSKCE